MKTIKLAVFDLEGTLIRNSYRGNGFPSIWKVLCNLCGPLAAEKDAENTKKFYEGGYPGYIYWVMDTIEILKDHELKKAAFESVIKALEYYPGVAETMRVLKNAGIRIAIISGGLKALADRVAIDHGIEHVFASAEFYWAEDGTMLHWNAMPTDFKHKSSLLEMLCHDLRINRNECAFIGDGRNDKDVAGFAGLSIGFNPHIELRDAASVIIEQEKGKEDLSAILAPLLKYPFFSKDDFVNGTVWRLAEQKMDIVCSGANYSTLSESKQRDEFHAFLVENGLTSKSADSYCSYVNNLCRNIAETKWNGASSSNSFSVLEQAVAESSCEDVFITNLGQPLAGKHGRENDLTSAAKQFFRFSKIIKTRGH